MKIAPDADAVDRAWLAEALGFPGLLLSFEAMSIGTGQVGENVRYCLTWADGAVGAPGSVVGKFPSVDETSRAVGIATDSYVHEVGFYRDAQSSADIRSPQCFYIGDDLAHESFVLLMEDIASSTQGDQIDGGTIAHAYLAATQAARLHGPFWDSPALAQFDWIAASTDQTIVERGDLYNMLFPGFVDRYRSRLSTEVLEWGRWLGDHSVARSRSLDLPKTLIHGDFRLDNMLFGDDPEIVVVDWQTAAIGSGAQDLAYFVGAGLLPHHRRTSENDLVNHYVESLRAYVTVDHEAVWHDYVLGSATGFFMAVVASQIVGQTERGDEMFAVMAERHAEQMDDLDIAALVASS